MASLRPGLTLIVALGSICSFVHAQEKPANGPAAVAALAAKIDAHVAAGYAREKVVPSPLADDSEFIRRVYLDVVGRVPRVSETRQFLEDRSPDKRSQLVEKLLSSPQYAGHFTNVWRVLLVPNNNNPQLQFFGTQLEPWLRKRLMEDVPYNRIVRELLTSSIPVNGIMQGRAVNYQIDGNPLAFFQFNEYKPENLAAATSRLFLGIKLECAQCHDHPFAKWSRQQFWEYAAFFAGFQRPMNVNQFQALPENPDKFDLQIPGTDKTVKAKYLGGGEPKLDKGARGTAILAEWLTAPANPFLARAAVNRAWGHFFGIGIVDPVDDFGEDNQPTHPELLNDLTKAFADSGFDTKFLIRAITSSKTYQLSSQLATGNVDQPRLFHRMALKGLTPEQLFDSLAQATGYRENALQPQQRFAFNAFGTARAEFLNKFGNASDKRTEYQTSILQALALMNGRFVADATHLERSEALAAVLDSPFLDWKQRLDTLFLATLCRPMRAEEASRLVKYVSDGGPSKDSRKAAADVFWALLNSTEFFLNH